MKLCIRCDDPVLTTKHKSQKYCSRKCYYLARFPDRRIESVCQNCSKDFWYYASRGAVKFCSQKCYTSTPKSDEFKQKISKAFRGENHPNWKGGVMKGRQDRNLMEYKEWRKFVFARDSYTCVFCEARNHPGLGYSVQLEADHIKSWADYPELRYEVSNGRTLCKDCHSKRTAQQHRERMNYATI